MQHNFKEVLLNEMERIIRLIKESNNVVKTYNYPTIEGKKLNIRIEFTNNIDIDGEIR
jgi:hypothetical protein